MGQCFNPDEMKAYYLCDPEKNTKCRKASCKHNPNAKHRVCDRTTLEEAAVRDEKGSPIVLEMRKRRERCPITVLRSLEADLDLEGIPVQDRQGQ